MEATETFDVVIIGFDDRDEPPEARLQRAFGIEAATAQQLLSRLPATVQRAVSRVRAEYFRRALHLIGAHAEVRDREGMPVPAEGESLAEAGAGEARNAPFAYAEPSHAGDGLAFSDTSRAPSPWFEPAPVAPHATSAGAHAGSASDLQSAVPLRAPHNPTLREAAAAAHPAGPGGPPLVRAAPTALDLDVPARGPSTSPAAPFVPTERPQTERQFAAVNPTFLASAPPSVPARPPAAPTAATAAPAWDPAPALLAPPPAAGAVSPPAPPAPAPAWLTSLPSGVFDPPPAHTDRNAGPELLAPRDPSSLFDPPPQAVAGPLPPAAARGVASAPLPDIGFAPAEPAWAPAREPAQAITFDADPHASPLRVLSPWEQPGTTSMAEPVARPRERVPSRRPPRERPRRAPRAVAPAPGGVQPPNAQPAPPRSAVGIPDRRSTGRTLGNADTRSFWETLGEALALPFAGAGPYWIGAITVWSVVVAFFGFLANFMFLLGAIVMFFANTSLLAFACDYYRACAWVPLAGDDRIERGPEFDPVRVLNTYIKSGVHLTLFTIVSQLPLIAWVASTLSEEGLVALPELMLHPVTWLLFLLPYFYWPMGVGLTALGNDFAAIWNVPAGIRAITRAPLEYTVIVAIGVLTFIVSGIALFVFGSMLGVTGVLVSGTVGFPLAISHGIQGALLGHLARARSEIFE